MHGNAGESTVCCTVSAPIIKYLPLQVNMLAFNRFCIFLGQIRVI